MFNRMAYRILYAKFVFDVLQQAPINISNFHFLSEDINKIVSKFTLHRIQSNFFSLTPNLRQKEAVLAACVR